MEEEILAVVALKADGGGYCPSHAKDHDKQRFFWHLRRSAGSRNVLLCGTDHLQPQS